MKLKYPPLIKLIAACLVAFSYSQALHAQSDSSDARVLVLHGVWKNDFWEKEFDDAFIKFARELIQGEVQTSSQYLGLNQSVTTEMRRRLQENVAWIIEQQSVDAVVAVLPAAIEFFQEMPISSQIPSVLVLPAIDQLARAEPAQAAVLSGSQQAMERTLEQIGILLPEVNTIEVFAGNSENDTVYLRRFQDIAPNYANRFRFNYTVGQQRAQFIEKARNFPESTAIFSLPYESFGESRQASDSNSLSLLTEASAVPVFGTYDSQLVHGIAGGNLTSVEGTASSAAIQVNSLLNGLDTTDINQGTDTFYYWDAVQKWDIPIDRLNDPLQLVGEPGNLFRDYPVLSTIGINAILLLTIGLFAQGFLYRRSMLAKAQIKASETAALESEEKYRLLANNVADVIWVMEEGDTHLKYCSPSAERVTGYSAEECMEMPIRDMMSEEDMKKLSRAIGSGSRDIVVSEQLLRRKDGSRIWIEMVVRKSRTLPDGRCEWVGVTRDISTRKENEEEKEFLEQQVRQSQKFESLGTLAGGIAHDFNNILTVIFGVTDMLRLQESQDATTQRLLDRLNNASEKARSLVQQILTFSRRSKGEKEIVDVQNVIHDCFELFHSGKSANIEFDIRTASGAYPVLANKNQLEQTVINLLTNALEAVPEESGKITMEMDSVNIESYRTLLHGELKPGKYVHIQVQDNGIGISAIEQAKIFDPFFTSKELGNGMGLAIVHGIIMDHGGGIDLHSRVGAGTIVHLYLPLAEQTPVSATSHEPNEVRMGYERKRIMVVDDKKELLQVAEEMLERLGHDCITFCDGFQAKAYMEEKPDDIDLLITDYSMPGMNGVELMRYCHDNWPELPVVISSGYGDQTTRLSAEKNRTFGILDKPYSIHQLKKLLDSFPQDVARH
jgi:PAS domain S-box-containing protein